MKAMQFVCRMVASVLIMCLWQPGVAAEPVVEQATEPVSLDDLRAFAEAWEHIKSSYVEPVDDRRLLEAAIRGMVAELDPHSSWLTREEFKRLEEQATGQYGGLGIRVALQHDHLQVVDAPVESPAGRGGLRPGDRIIGIDRIRLSGANIEEAANWLRGPPGSTVDLTVERDGAAESVHLTVTRDTIHRNSVSSEWPMEGIALIRIDSFQQTTASELDRVLSALAAAESPLRALILDLRDNPGGMLQAAVAVSDRFLSSQLIVTAKGRGPDANQRLMAHEGQALAGIPILVLVNRLSASAAEIVAGALQDHRRARVLGEPTYGKGSVQTIWPLVNGSGIRLTTSRFYTPSGRSIQDDGIVPDIDVPQSSEGSNVNDDPVMQRALEILIDEQLGFNRTDKRPRIAIVMDDMGYQTGFDQAVLELDQRVAVAIIPQAPDATGLANRAASQRREVLIHLPLAGLGHDNCQPVLTCIGQDWSDELMRQHLHDAMIRVPGAAGINNHQGSRFTGDRAAVDRLVGAIVRVSGDLEQPMFVLDSRTVADSYLESVARQAGLPATRRRVFLDHDNDPRAIALAWEDLIMLARRHGDAVAIGHPRHNTLAFLREQLPLLEAQGLELVAVSKLATLSPIRDRYSRPADPAAVRSPSKSAERSSR